MEAIDLLIRHGASVDPVKWSRFVGAERLLRHRANVNFQNPKGLTALHLLLKKGSDRRYVEMLLRHGADPTLESRDGKSPLDLVAKRRDRTYLDLLRGSLLSSRSLRE